MNYAGKNLKFLMTKLNVSQAKLEPIVNKKQQTISNWISEKTQMDTEDLVNLTDFFGIALDDFCLIDLSESNLITDSYIAKFRVKGNLMGNGIGNLITTVHKKIGELGEEKPSQMEGGDAGMWAVFQVLQQMNGKLDQIKDSLNNRESK